MALVSLTDLPACVNLTLLSYLDASSKYQLSRTCVYFQTLIESPWLWKYIDARQAPDNNAQKVKFVTDKIYKGTRMLLLRGQHSCERILPLNFFKNIAKFDLLTVLALERQAIGEIGRDPKETTITMKNFPRSLEEISLKQSHVYSPHEFFRQSYESKPNLKVLILDKCQWVSTATFMSLSKYQNLEILSLYSCKNVGNSIPYLSLAWQFGFKKLKIVDARLTRLGNTLIRSLYRSQSVLAVYLQNGDVSYQIDVAKRQLALLKGAKLHPCGEDIHLGNLVEPEQEHYVRFLDSRRVLDDSGIIDFSSVCSKKCDDVKFPKSQLYLDPYNTCNCGYEEKERKKKPTANSGAKSRRLDFGNSSDSSDDDNDDNLSGVNLAAVGSVRARLLRLKRFLHHSQRARHVPLVWPESLLRNESPPLSPPSPPPETAPSDRRKRPSSNHSNSGGNKRSADNFNAGPSTSRDDGAGCSRDTPTVNNTPQSRLKRLQMFGTDFLPKRLKFYNDEGELVYSNGNWVNDEVGESEREASMPETPRFFNVSIPEANVIRIEPNFPRANRDMERLQRLLNPDDEQNHDDPIRFINVRRLVNFGENGQNVKESVPIKRLSFRGFDELTDAIMVYIADLDLEILDLYYTKISVAAINNYLVSHPYCRVIHPKFCRCPVNLDF